jgi:sugar O-acyltransferase (sialic acid O-acetyltransferase NeuD family)
MKQDIILLGGGDHCRSAIDVIEQQDSYRIVGILDKPEFKGTSVLGYEVIGTDNDLPNLIQTVNYFFVTIGHIKTALPRKKAFELLKSYHLNLPVIISPIAYVSRHSIIGEGTIIMHNSIIDIEAKVGRNCIINHATTIGHNAIIADNCHVSANCVLGECEIGEETFIGGNSWVTNRITIASNCVIGSGSNVIKNIGDSGIYAGNPAKFIRYNDQL